MALAFLALVIAAGAAFPIQVGPQRAARDLVWAGPIRAPLISFSVASIARPCS